MKKSFLHSAFLVSLLLFAAPWNFAQTAGPDSAEIFLFESFIPPENPDTLVISFFATAPVRSGILVGDAPVVTISDTLAEDHSANIDISEMMFDSASVVCLIRAEDAEGRISHSEPFVVKLPEEVQFSKSAASGWQSCLFGGLVYMIPTVGYVYQEGSNGYTALSKEFPLLGYYASGYTFPSAYLAVEYQHIVNFKHRNFFRVGYKQVFRTPGIQFVSVGLNAATDFLGYNGLTPEVTLGFFNFSNVFTVYGRARYTFQPGVGGNQFAEFSIGLFTAAFTLHL